MRLQSALLRGAVALSITLAGGCALTVGMANPRPNLDLPQSQQSLALNLDSNIHDEFSVPSQNGVIGADFKGWRSSLENGFRSGFAESFKAAADKADLTVAIVEAEPSFAPTSVAVNQYGSTIGAASIVAQIRYKARLLDASGNVVGRSAGTVRAKTSITNRFEATNTVANAIETLYEKLAEDLFHGPTPATK